MNDFTSVITVTLKTCQYPVPLRDALAVSTQKEWFTEAPLAI